MSKVLDPKSAERFWEANCPPSNQGHPPGLRWSRLLPEKPSHDALYLAPHPIRHPENGHKIYEDVRQYRLQQHHTTTTGAKPSLPSAKTGLDLCHYRLSVTSLPFARGSPRYRMGSKTTGVASTADTRFNSSKDNLMPATDDFPLFNCRPEKSENISSMADT